MQVLDVSKAYGSTRALSRVSLEVRPGEVHALVGGNGSGKSTLVKILSGVVHADEGSLTLGERRLDLTSMTPALARACGFAFVHQEEALAADLTVAENLAFGTGFATSRTGRVRWREVNRQAQAVLEEFHIDAGPRDVTGELPPATRTMVAIARALHGQDAAQGSFLALDEPTASLTLGEVTRLLAALRTFAAHGHAILIISHRLDEVMAVADRVTVLRDGRGVGTADCRELTRGDLVERIVGRPLDDYFPDAAGGDAGGPAMLEVDGLRGGALRGVSLRVRPSEILGVAGAAGSGRSTLLRMLFGAERPGGGEIRLAGEPVRLTGPGKAIGLGIAYVPEDRVRDALFPDLSITENVSAGPGPRHWRHGVYRHRAERRETRSLMDEFGVVARSAASPAATLSGGNQQKVVLARWMREHRRVLLLDEPTQGVDVGARRDIWTSVRRATASGTAAVVASSDLEELAHACDRVAVLHDGRIVAEAAPPNLTVDRLNHLLHSGEEAA